MTQNLPPEITSGNIFSRYPFLTRSVSLMGSLSLLGSGISLAQTNQVVDSIGMPTPSVTPAPAPKAAPAPPRVVAPTPPPRAVAPAPPRAVAPAPRVAPPRVSAPISISKPVKVNPPAPVLSAPRVTVSSPPRVENTQGVTRLLPQPTATPPKPTVIAPRSTVSNGYVDPTNYNVRTPANNRKPASLVVTERVSGCKTVVQNGQLSQGSCARTQPVQRRTVAASSPRRPSSPRQSYEGTRKPVPVVATRSIAVRSQSTPKAVTKTQPTSPQPETAKLKPVSPQKLASQVIKKFSQQYGNNSKTDLLFPLSIPARISSSFGWRTHPISKTVRLHAGTDIAAPLGTPVLSAYEGEVEVADYVKGYGNMVILRHLDGTQESRYAHLHEIFVEPGQWVEQGVVIGSVGSTGYSTGPHLHFEWRHLMESGWVSVDAGLHLEYAMENLLNTMELAQAEAL